MGVDGEGGSPHREDEHARGRLRTHAGQRDEIRLDRRVIQVVQAAEVEATLPLLDGGQDLLDAARLLVGDAAAADGVGNVLRRRVQNLFPMRKSGLELPVRPFRVDVGGVLRQHGRHDLVDDREPRLGGERALPTPQAALHRSDAPCVGHRHVCRSLASTLRRGYGGPLRPRTSRARSMSGLR
jgi:hypothetical protein